MYNRFVFAAGLTILAFVAGCRDSGEGDYFHISGKIFVFNYRVATATYLVTLQPSRPPVEGQTAVARFEDPAGGAPLVVRQKIWPKLDKTVLESPPLRCVVKDRTYAIAIVIEDEEGRVLQTIETSLASSIDQSVLPDRPLVVGPVYMPNPDLVGRPDGKLEITNEAGCQAKPDRP